MSIRLRPKILKIIDSVILSDLKRFNIKSKKDLIQSIIDYFIIENKDQFFIKFESNQHSKVPKIKYDFTVRTKEHKAVKKFMEAHGNLSDSDLLKSLIFSYRYLPSYKRELIAHYKTNSKLLKIIENKQIINIKYEYNDKYTEVAPLFIDTENERFNYLCVCTFNKKYQRIIAYRLSNISDVQIVEGKDSNYIDRENLGLCNNEYYQNRKISIDDLKKNFDPFLAYLYPNVTIKLTQNGKQRYKRLVDKPKILKGVEKLDKKGSDTFIIEASSFSTKILAGNILEDIEILEPKKLRDEFRDSLEYVFNKYSLNNIKIISDIIIKKLVKIGMEYEFYDEDKNEIFFSRKIENNEFYFNIEFNKQGIKLSLFIKKYKKYDIFHKELFKDKKKKEYKNRIIKLTKNWSGYIYDTDNQNLENNLKNDLDTIFKKISEYDKNISEIEKKNSLNIFS